MRIDRGLRVQGRINTHFRSFCRIDDTGTYLLQILRALPANSPSCGPRCESVLGIKGGRSQDEKLPTPSSSHLLLPVDNCAVCATESPVIGGGFAGEHCCAAELSRGGLWFAFAECEIG